MYQTSQNDPQQQALHVDALDFEHRLAAEKELSKSTAKKFQTMCFDESSNFLVYPSMLGIKIVNIRMNKVRLNFSQNNTERDVDYAFLRCVLIFCCMPFPRYTRHLLSILFFRFLPFENLFSSSSYPRCLLLCERFLSCQFHCRSECAYRVQVLYLFTSFLASVRPPVPSFCS